LHINSYLFCRTRNACQELNECAPAIGLTIIDLSYHMKP
jgi:hypothetical protein